MTPDTRFKNPTCVSCAERIKSGYVPCNECGPGAMKPSNARSFHPIRGEFFNNWCERCNGDGRVHIGVPEHLKGEPV